MRSMSDKAWRLHCSSRYARLLSCAEKEVQSEQLKRIGSSPVKEDDSDALCDLPELAEFLEESVIVHHLILHSLHGMDDTLKALSLAMKSLIKHWESILS